MKRNRRVHFIAWTHDLTFGDPIYEPHQHRRFPWSQLLTKLPACDYCAISVQRQKDMRRLFRVPRSELPVIPDGIDVPEQRALTPVVARLFREERLDGIDIVALTPARILRRKNLGVGMEIVAALKKQGKSVRWIVSGAPDVHNLDSVKYYRMLIALRRQLRVQREVIFLCDRFQDGVTNDDLRALYNMSDMLLMPSEREGFGLPVLEAGLAGLLVVINDIPVLRELAGRHAVYIRLGDSAETIARNVVGALKKRPELIYRKQVISNYSWEVVFSEHILPAVLKPHKVWGRS
jgi:glycosyltransferase involved in cell wall biosynthesis